MHPQMIVVCMLRHAQGRILLTLLELSINFSLIMAKIIDKIWNSFSDVLVGWWICVN